VEEDSTVAQEIDDRLRKGYSYDQLVHEYGFSPRSVRRQMDKVVEPEKASSASPGNDRELPVIYKQTEVLNPEAMLRRYLNGTYEDQLEFRGMMKLRAAILMVMELVNIEKGSAEAHAKLMEPVLKLMQEARLEQDAAAQRARASSLEAAREAAEETAARTAQYWDQHLAQLQTHKADIATTQHPMQGLFARLMETMFTNLVGSMFPQPRGQSSLPPGLEDGGVVEGNL
jgi:hypothetical protein